MPIELLSFEAKPEGSHVLIAWVTATETNNDYFTIEKSKDGLRFETVAIRAGAGNSSVTNVYQLTDEKP